jgi:thioredoxin-like negative regulator of GroEL
MRKLAWLCGGVMVGALGANAQANAHAGKAIQLMQERHYNEAAGEFEQSLAVSPSDDTVRIQYATCLFVQERDEEARKQFEMERQRLGEQPGLNYFLGQLDLRANDFSAAIRRLEPLATNAAFPKAAFYLGLAYLSEGRDKAGLESLERETIRTIRKRTTG